jgi:cystathionine beta-lyase
MEEQTKLTVLGRNPAAHSGAVNVPVVRASTILYDSVADIAAKVAARERDEPAITYGRSGTPTTFAFTQAIAELENGYRTVCFPSGAAACAIPLLACVKTGDHVLVVDCAYGPTRAFCEGTLRRMGVEVEYFDPALGAGVAALLRPNTAVLFLESPGSHTFEMQDVPAMAAAVRPRGVKVLIDNTWATPLLYKPLDHGADIVIHAATKYIVGHSDAMLGIATANKEAWPLLKAGWAQFGQSAAPDDLFLALRGLRTMAVRLRQHQESALEVAAWLRGRPEVKQVLYPALPGAPGHDIWKRDFKGASGLFAIELRPVAEDRVSAFIDSLDLFGIGFSWGGFESLAVPGKVKNIRTASKWTFEGPLVRLHIGLEAPADLIADLSQGLKNLA